MTYSYFPGCNLKTNAKGYEDTAIEVSKVLNAELVEMPIFNCCGTVHTMTSDNVMRRIAPVRILARSSEHQKELENSQNIVATLCSMCSSTLKIVNEDIRENPETLEKINWQLERDDLKYDGNIEVKHFLEILRDDVGYEQIAVNVKKPLKGMKVASYYGCMLLHPDKAKIDDSETPSVMESLSQALGAEVVDWPYFKYCCGSYHVVDKNDIVNRQVLKIINGAKQRGANAIIVACPLCAYNLDNQQKEMQKKGVIKETIPIFYFTQLMAIALGLPIELNKFEKHFIDPKPLLKDLGLLQ
ncbi:MAG: CoB--CoM heterodisulfide reductase iron-sulfur subunit B family protein [Candidatus Heimdallarchaeaceae archaeon]